MQKRKGAMEILAEQGADRGIDQYRAGLRSAVRGLWSGAMDDFQAWDIFDLSIRRFYTKAYYDGAKEVGILPGDLTPEEKIHLRSAIQRETNFIDGFLNAIMQGSKANGGKLSPLFNRVELWVQRYQQIYTDGMMTAKDDPKLLWVWHPEAEHCSSCAALQGKVKRKSQWDKAALYPQSPRLECMQSAGGITVCKCHFEPTTDPASKGPLPRI